MVTFCGLAMKRLGPFRWTTFVWFLGSDVVRVSSRRTGPGREYELGSIVRDSFEAEQKKYNFHFPQKHTQVWGLQPKLHRTNEMILNLFLETRRVFERIEATNKGTEQDAATQFAVLCDCFEIQE